MGYRFSWGDDRVVVCCAKMCRAKICRAKMHLPKVHPTEVLPCTRRYFRRNFVRGSVLAETPHRSLQPSVGVFLQRPDVPSPDG